MSVKIERFDAEKMDATMWSNQIYAILCTDYEQSPWSKHYILSDLQLETSEYFLARNDDELLGFLALSRIMDEVEITNIAVRRDCQGQGIATRLLTALSNFTGTIFLEVRESNFLAQKLYEKLGFVRYHFRANYYTEPIENAILMRKIQD